MTHYDEFDVERLKLKSLEERVSKSDESIMVLPDRDPPEISDVERDMIGDIAGSVMESRRRGKPVVLAYGAHLFKNGCSPIVNEMIRKNIVTQLLTNGAGVIHDFEMAYIGRTEEDVRKYMAEGQFGLWDETGEILNSAIIAGARDGLGLGESVGRVIVGKHIEGREIPIKSSKYSIVGKAYEKGVPLSVCPGIGYDIIHMHPLCDGAALGETALRDFRIYANTLTDLEGGVILSVGSAVMAPMVTEKALSMAKNAVLNEGGKLENYRIVVNDIQGRGWNDGEPSKDDPAYYLRFCKSFARMGGSMDYVCMDNRAFLHNLYEMIH